MNRFGFLWILVGLALSVGALSVSDPLVDATADRPAASDLMAAVVLPIDESASADPMLNPGTGGSNELTGDIEISRDRAPLSAGDNCNYPSTCTPPPTPTVTECGSYSYRQPEGDIYPIVRNGSCPNESDLEDRLRLENCRLDYFAAIGGLPAEVVSISAVELPRIRVSSTSLAGTFIRETTCSQIPGVVGASVLREIWRYEPELVPIRTEFDCGPYQISTSTPEGLWIATIQECVDPQLFAQTGPPSANCEIELRATVGAETADVTMTQNLGMISGFLLDTSQPMAGGFIQLVKTCDNRSIAGELTGPALKTFVWTWSDAPSLASIPTGCHQLSNGGEILISSNIVHEPNSAAGTGLERKPWVSARMHCDPTQEPTNVNYVLYVVAGFHPSSFGGFPACGELRSPTLPFGYYSCVVI